MPLGRLWLLLLSTHVAAQTGSAYTFRHLDHRNGLLHNTVTAIAQDAKGYMWMNTRNGLQRYDGLRFTAYPQMTDVNNPSNLVNLLTEGASVWMGYGDLSRLNTTTNLATHFKAADMFRNPDFRFERYTDAAGRSWLLGRFGLYMQEKGSKQPSFVGGSLPGTAKYGNCVVYDSAEKHTWVLGYYGAYLFDAQTKAVYSKAFNPLHHPLLEKPDPRSIATVLMDTKRNIWMGTWSGLIHCYNLTENKLHTYSLKRILEGRGAEGKDYANVTTTCFYEDRQGSLWIATDRFGLLRYTYADGRLALMKAKSEESTGLRYNYEIYCITGDREGNIWLGTDKGISIFNPYSQPFQILAHEEGNEQSLPKSEITSVFQVGDSDVYVSTWGDGFSIFDKNLAFKKTVRPKGTYEMPLLWDFAAPGDGTVWVAAQHGYIHVYHPATGALKTIRPPETERYTVRCIRPDAEGNLWLGMHSGKIVKWDRQTKKFLTPSDGGIANAWPVSSLLVDAQGRIWAATDEGLFRFDAGRRCFVSKANDTDRDSVGGIKFVRGMEQLNDSTLLVGTLHRGLFLFNIRTARFSPYPLAATQGINIFALKKEPNGNVWFSSDYELFSLNTATNQLLRYKVQPGLMNASFETDRFFPLSDGRLATASYTEAVVFHPEDLIHTEERAKEVTITGVKLFDKPLTVDSFLDARAAVPLKHDQNFLTIEFNTLNYSGSKETEFYYRLSGVDTGWVKADENAAAVYKNLSPDDYKFEVKAGKEAAAPLTAFRFAIAPPFYGTWWFKTLAAAALIAAVYFSVRRRIKNIRHKAELKHRIAQAEINALRAQMNPHFIFNCLNAIDNMIQTGQKEKATTYLSRFAKLIRSVLDSTRNNVVPVHKDFETLKLYLELEKFRCADKFDYTLEADPELLNGDYKIPPLVVQPFLENAIHHGLMNKDGDDRRLAVSIRREDENIRYTIKDNGVGRRAAMDLKTLNKPEHQSYGIQISTDRIAMHNGSANGSSVVITDLYAGDKPSGTQIEVLIKADR